MGNSQTCCALIISESAKSFSSEQRRSSSQSQLASKKCKSNSIGPAVIVVQPLKVNTLMVQQNVPSSRSNRPEDTAMEPQQLTQDNKKNKELTTRDKEIIAWCWRTHIQTGRRDIFHRTMLFCIEASPKLNEIIACQRYCFRDLTKWPKLDRICKAQFNFFERLIYELNLDERKVREACTRLGQTHANYGQYGMKPHFLDIYHQQLLGLISNLPFENVAEERQPTVAAFNRFISLIVDTMNQACSQSMMAEHRDRIKVRGGNKDKEAKMPL